MSAQAILTNLGDVPGDCVVQAYIGYPDNVLDANDNPADMSVKALRAFDKIHVGTTNEEQRQIVKIELTRKDLSYWDVMRQNWILRDGDFKIYLGFSSRNLPLTERFANTLTLNFSNSNGKEKDGPAVVFSISEQHGENASVI